LSACLKKDSMYRSDIYKKTAGRAGCKKKHGKSTWMLLKKGKFMGQF